MGFGDRESNRFGLQRAAIAEKGRVRAFSIASCLLPLASNHNLTVLINSFTAIVRSKPFD